MGPLRAAPRIMLVKPSSLAKRTLASVNGPNTPNRGFHSTGRTRSCATAAAVARPPINVRLVIPLRYLVGTVYSITNCNLVMGNFARQNAFRHHFGVLRHARQRA